MGKHNSVVTSGRIFIYPATGFQSDIEALLQRFVETKTVRFEEFSRLWREANFSLIHVGRRGVREKREFCEEAFKIAFKFFIPPYSFQVRVGALYLLYALYYTQRTVPKVRIRVPLACLQQLESFHRDIVDKKHLDTVYILSKMKSGGIFEYCAFPSHLSIEDLYTCDQDEPDVGDINRNQIKSREKSLFDKLWDEDSIGQLNAVHEKYHQLKCLHNGDRGGDPNVPSSSLDLIQDDVISSIAAMTQEKEQAVILSPIRKPPPAKLQSTESSKRAQLVREIKSRAATARANTDSGSMRFLNTSPPRTTDAKDPTSPPKRRRKGRPYNTSTKTFDPNKIMDYEKVTPEVFSPKVIPTKKTNLESSGDFLIKPIGDVEGINVKSESNEASAFPFPNGSPLVENESPRNDGFSLQVSHENAAQNNHNDFTENDDSQNLNAETSEALFGDGVESRNDAEKVNNIQGEKEKRAMKKKMAKIKVPDEKESLNIKLTLNKFVALKPLPLQTQHPLVVKVIDFDEETIEGIWYEGAYTTKWTASRVGEGEDRKFVKATIARKRVLATVPITVAGKLSGHVIRKLKQLYSKIHYDS